MILKSNSNHRIALIFLGILFLTSASQAQEVQKGNAWALKLQYVGEFILHPGFAIGTDYTITSNDWFNLHWDTEIGGYFHKRNNNSVFVQSTLGTRFTTGFALFADFQLGLGCMLSMPDGDVYRVDDTGNLELKGRPVTSHLKPTSSLLFGWDGKRNRDIPISVFTGLEAYMQSGFNHVLLPHVAYRLGVTYQL